MFKQFTAWARRILVARYPHKAGVIRSGFDLVDEFVAPKVEPVLQRAVGLLRRFGNWLFGPSPVSAVS